MLEADMNELEVYAQCYACPPSVAVAISRIKTALAELDTAHNTSQHDICPLCRGTGNAQFGDMINDDGSCSHCGGTGNQQAGA
jgi:hypothetical protein